MPKKYCVFLLVLPVLLFSGEIDKEISFSPNGLEFDEMKGYDVVRLKGCTPTTIIGEPELALKPIMVLIPPHARVKNVEIISVEKVSVQRSLRILPVQHPEVYSVHEPFPFVEPKEEVYAHTAEYPGVLAKITHTGTKGGYRIVTITLYPLQYIPKQGKLSLYTYIKFKVIYEEGRVIPETVWKEEYEYHKDEVKRAVINPEYVEHWGPFVKECNRSMHAGTRGTFFDNPEYAIMVADGFESDFEPLRDWKIQKGVPTEIFSRDWILSNYTGADDPEKIRNFIIDFHQNHGTQYFLCVGDWDDFPMRLVPTVTHPINSPVPSDLYYQDYDEDFYSEVFVGRASIDNQTEAQTFVNKVLLYEKEPPAMGSGFYNKIFLPAYYVPDGAPLNDSVAVFDPEWWTDAKRYDFINPLSVQEVSDSFNAGFGYANFSSHGTWAGWGGGSIDDADALTNAPPRTGIMMANSCMIGRLDYASSDCYVEHMMNNPNGGTVAFWANSRLGIGPIKNLGRTPWLIIWFYDGLATTEVLNIGKTCAASKDRAVPYTSDIRVVHCMHELNLFGDPEMPQWTRIPRVVQVAHDASVQVGLSSIDITVTDENSIPIENARVCVTSQQDDVYDVGYTNASGIASLTIEPVIVDDTLMVTVTAGNKIPHMSSILVTPASGPYVVARWNVVLDLSGNNNGIVNPGEAIDLGIWAKNMGLQTAYSVDGELATSDLFVSMANSKSKYGNIRAVDSSLSKPYYTFSVAENCPNDHTIEFTLEFTDRHNNTWTSRPKLKVYIPILIYDGVNVVNDENSNGALEPGETADLLVLLKNKGGDTAEHVKSLLTSSSPYITINSPTSFYGDIEPGATADNAAHPFNVTASSEALYLTEVDFSLLVVSDLTIDTLDFTMNLGHSVPTDTGYYYAYYSGGPHIHSPTFEWIAIDSTQTEHPGVSLDSSGYWWYGGIVELPFTFTYYGQEWDSIGISAHGWVNFTLQNRVPYDPYNDPLPTRSAPMGLVGCLWDWLEVSNPGEPSDVYYYYDEPNHRFVVEYFQVEHYEGGDYETFEIIFYDPAYYQTPTGDGEIVLQYLTAPQQDDFTVGIQNRRRTVGLQYYFDGTYHDLAASVTDSFAIKITTKPPVPEMLRDGALSHDKPMNTLPTLTLLSTPYPNPFTKSVKIAYQVAGATMVGLQVYDAAGRLVRNLVDGVCHPGYYNVVWNGCDNVGRRVPAGVYFVRFETDNCTKVNKTILLR